MCLTLISMGSEADSSCSSNLRDPSLGIVRDHIYISDGPEIRTICESPHLPASMQRNHNWQLEDFEVLKELYRGKTSLLYKAIDKLSGTMIALKLYRKKKLSLLNRYQVEREIRIHIKLDHANVIKLYAAFEDEKNVYMVQEFAASGDLFEELKKGGGTMKEKQTVKNVIQPFLSALGYMHDRGIIHRDIKPENILLTASKEVKVADFGLSIDTTQERPVTRAGTLDYMAPEVLVCPDKRRPEENKDKVSLAYTAQVDCWAVGILAYELLVGYPPFEQESRAATYEHIMYKEPKFPSWMSEDAKKFMLVALSKSALQRPSIKELAELPWIQRFTEPGPSTVTSDASTSSCCTAASAPALSITSADTACSRTSSSVSSTLATCTTTELPIASKPPKLQVPAPADAAPSSSSPVTSPSKQQTAAGSPLPHKQQKQGLQPCTSLTVPSGVSPVDYLSAQHYDSISDPTLSGFPSSATGRPTSQQSHSSVTSPSGSSHYRSSACPAVVEVPEELDSNNNPTASQPRYAALKPVQSPNKARPQDPAPRGLSPPPLELDGDCGDNITMVPASPIDSPLSPETDAARVPALATSPTVAETARRTLPLPYSPFVDCQLPTSDYEINATNGQHSQITPARLPAASPANPTQLGSLSRMPPRLVAASNLSRPVSRNGSFTALAGMEPGGQDAAGVSEPGSPQPRSPLASTFTRPASGVLSDDTALLPARALSFCSASRAASSGRLASLVTDPTAAAAAGCTINGGPTAPSLLPSDDVHSAQHVPADGNSGPTGPLASKYASLFGKMLNLGTSSGESEQLNVQTSPRSWTAKSSSQHTQHRETGQKFQHSTRSTAYRGSQPQHAQAGSSVGTSSHCGESLQLAGRDGSFVLPSSFARMDSPAFSSTSSAPASPGISSTSSSPLRQLPSRRLEPPSRIDSKGHAGYTLSSDTDELSVVPRMASDSSSLGRAATLRGHLGMLGRPAGLSQSGSHGHGRLVQSNSLSDLHQAGAFANLPMSTCHSSKETATCTTCQVVLAKPTWEGAVYAPKWYQKLD